MEKSFDIEVNIIQIMNFIVASIVYFFLSDDIGNDKAFINTIQGLKLDNRSRKLLAKRRKRASTVTASSFEALIEGLQEVSGAERKGKNLNECIHNYTFTTFPVHLVYLSERTLSFTYLSLQRQSKREGWHGRERDPAFESVPLDCQPMSIPFPFLASTIFKNGDGDDNTIDKGDDDRMERTDQTETTRLLEKKGESLPDLFITIEELRTYHEMYLRLVLQSNKSYFYLKKDFEKINNLKYPLKTKTSQKFHFIIILVCGRREIQRHNFCIGCQEQSSCDIVYQDNSIWHLCCVSFMLVLV